MDAQSMLRVDFDAAPNYKYVFSPASPVRILYKSIVYLTTRLLGRFSPLSG